VQSKCQKILNQANIKVDGSPSTRTPMGFNSTYIAMDDRQKSGLESSWSNTPAGAFAVERPRSPRSWPGSSSGSAKPVWNLSGVATVLYQLPELLTPDPARTVWIVEGEKDVDRLRLLGEVATCSPMGAGKWFDDYVDPLRDRICRIIQDKDEPGRQHTLRGKALSVSIVQLPGLPDRGDVSDFLDSGHTMSSWHWLKRLPSGNR
jgi:hypothetical protein